MFEHGDLKSAQKIRYKSREHCVLWPKEVFRERNLFLPYFKDYHVHCLLGQNRSEGLPERDIWSLGVMLPGLSQMGRVLGKPSPPPPPSPSPPSLLPGGSAPRPPPWRPMPLIQHKTPHNWRPMPLIHQKTPHNWRPMPAIQQKIEVGTLFLTKYEQKYNFNDIGMTKNQGDTVFCSPDIKVPAGDSHQRSPFQNLPQEN